MIDSILPIKPNKRQALKAFDKIADTIPATERSIIQSYLITYNKEQKELHDRLKRGASLLTSKHRSDTFYNIDTFFIIENNTAYFVNIGCIYAVKNCGMIDGKYNKKGELLDPQEETFPTPDFKEIMGRIEQHRYTVRVDAIEKHGYSLGKGFKTVVLNDRVTVQGKYFDLLDSDSLCIRDDNSRIAPIYQEGSDYIVLIMPIES